MTGTESITIVMATLNGAAHLSQQLDSIALQSHRNWQLFVTDDGSEDNTKDILAEFAREHRVTVVDGPRKGAAANFLSALCHPDLPREIIALADQDDIWLPGKLSRGLRRMGRSDDWPVLYAAESALTDEHGKPFNLSRSGRTLPAFAPSLAQNLFGGHTTMFNVPALDLLRAAGAPDGIAFHDWWIYQLIAGAGGRLVLDPAPMALYRQHRDNVLGASQGSGHERLKRVLSGQWRQEMHGHAQALASVAHLLTSDAQVTLSAFLAAPSRGFARIEAFRRLGLRRSSAKGEILMLGAAFAGLL